MTQITVTLNVPEKILEGIDYIIGFQEFESREDFIEHAIQSYWEQVANGLWSGWDEN